VSSLREIEAIEAEFNYYRDSVALLRARLYRRGVGTTPRLEELQRKADSAEGRLRAARAEPRPSPQP
jgi:TPP-dependent pyruvate/acetoin dehydrogenase alpha subunit